VNPPPSLPSGWFPDPHERYDHRWFNGTAWTADVSKDGVRLVDPDGAAPTPRQGGSHGGPHTGNKLATAALVCGIIGVTIAWIPLLAFVGVVLAVLAVVFGLRGRRTAGVNGAGGGKALAGLIMGIVGIGLSVIGIIWSVAFIDELMDFIEPGPVVATVDSCTVGDAAITVDATLTNRSDKARDYTVYAVIESPSGVDDLVYDLSGVPAGDTVDFQIRKAMPITSDTCEARLVVHGPKPYGIEIDRVND
jgi:hypothetical protein